MAAGNYTTPLNVFLLSEYLQYCPETGLLTWVKKPARRIMVGSVAGCKKSNDRPYVMLRFRGKMLYAHRVAWALYTGADVPAGKEIDHINGDHSDNRWSNLRIADARQNKANMSSARLASSGTRGVVWHKGSGKWQSQISHNNRCIYLGKFDSIEDARDARQKAEETHFGDYSFTKSRIKQ